MGVGELVVAALVQWFVVYVAFRVLPRFLRGAAIRIADRVSPAARKGIGRIPLAAFLVLLAVVFMAVHLSVNVQRINEATRLKVMLTEYLLNEEELPPVADVIAQYEQYYRLRDRSLVSLMAGMLAMLAAWVVPTRWNLRKAAGLGGHMLQAPKAFDNALTRWSSGLHSGEESGPKGRA